MGRNTVVFDAELYAIWIRLTAARNYTDDWAALGPKAITILTDPQAAVSRIRNGDPGPHSLRGHRSERGRAMAWVKERCHRKRYYSGNANAPSSLSHTQDDCFPLLSIPDGNGAYQTLFGQDRGSSFFNVPRKKGML
jgi:hypothetical protein